MRIALIFLSALMLGATPTGAKPVHVLLETTQGKIVLELDAQKAPKTVGNFVSYVEAGHYEGIIFHRVIAGFMAQAGGYDGNYKEKSTHSPIANESNNGLSNVRGSIAMARTSDPHSARAQFFINLVDNSRLDYRAGPPESWGYAVFGRVIEGMEVVDKIAAIPTGAGGPFRTDVPQTAVAITRAAVVERKR
jgi:peptidyl-prolyl cis-trans isomerase B (cyclophilin B)